MTIYNGHFNDEVPFDPVAKTARTVRDGTIKYLGSELDPSMAALAPDQYYTVYRSPATIANVAQAMAGIPVTDVHVDIGRDAPEGGGVVSSSKMVDAFDGATGASVAVLNRLEIADTLQAVVDAGKRELSLGYRAQLVPHGEHDFEQRDIVPHHLAVVQRGRCGSSCSFLDALPEEPNTNEDEPPMKHPKEFKDAEGKLSMQQMVALVTALPDAIKEMPVDQLASLNAPLAKIAAAIASVTGNGPAPEVAAAEEPAPAAEDEKPKDDPTTPEIEDELPGAKDEEDDKKFSDAEAASAILAHGEAMEKAREFMPAGHSFKDVDTPGVMRAALATQCSDKFSDAEVPLAFKLLRKAESKYKDFADETAKSTLDATFDKEL